MNVPATPVRLPPRSCDHVQLVPAAEQETSHGSVMGQLRAGHKSYTRGSLSFRYPDEWTNMLHVLADLEKLHFLERDYRFRCSSARTGDATLVGIGGRHLALEATTVLIISGGSMHRQSGAGRRRRAALPVDLSSLATYGSGVDCPGTYRRPGAGTHWRPAPCPCPRPCSPPPPAAARASAHSPAATRPAHGETVTFLRTAEA